MLYGSSGIYPLANGYLYFRDMKIYGFTIVRNALKFDFPIKECLASLSDLCDEVIVLVGKSEDDTWSYIRSLSLPNLHIHTSVWDESLKEGGRVLAAETDKALALVDPKSDWCVYLQADEVLHESDLETIKEAMKESMDYPEIDGLLFKYHHLYGSYHTEGISSNFYPHEIRAFKHGRQVYSYRDAQGFRKGDNQKLLVTSIDAHVYHYGWAREPAVMQSKFVDFNRKWYQNKSFASSETERDRYDYAYKDYCIVPFRGSHPKYMKTRIASMDWTFDVEKFRNELTFKDRLKKGLKTYLGIDTSYRNYELIKK